MVKKRLRNNIFSLMLALLPVSATTCQLTAESPHTAPAQVRAPFPTDEASMGQYLCAQLDLTRPEMAEVSVLAARSQFAQALAAWRDAKIRQFRAMDVGAYGWHDNQQHGNYVNFAARLAGRPVPASWSHPEGFTEDFGLSGPPSGLPDQARRADWLKRDAAGNYGSAFSGFMNLNGLVVGYWKSGDPIFLAKWFQIAADFSCHHKRAVEALEPRQRSKVPDNWSINAQSALTQSDRVMVLITSLGVFCKSLPGGQKPATWHDVYLPVTGQLPAESRALIPPLELAQVTLSLVQDHPLALLDRYEKRGAIPNQRFTGLKAILQIALVFPEFRASQELLTRGRNGLHDAIHGGYLADGGMLEQSFNYNRSVAEEMGKLAVRVESAAPEISQMLCDRQLAFNQMSAALSTPMARLPAVASHGPDNLPPVWRKGATPLLAARIKEFAGKSDPLVDAIIGARENTASAKALGFTSVAFPYSGYYAQRLNWQWDSPYLFMHAARRARGHASLDHNSVQVFAYGRPLLDCAGITDYYASLLQPSWRAEFDDILELFGENSSWKYNTVLVDGQSQLSKLPVVQTAPTETIAMPWHTSTHFDFMQGLYLEGYAGRRVTHQRQVIFLRQAGFWIITDKLESLDQKEHTFTQVWNFPGYRESKPSANGFREEHVVIDPAARVVRTIEPGSPNVWMGHAGGVTLSYEKFFGQRHPFRGWYKPGWDDLMPAPQVMIHWKGQMESLLITVIRPQADERGPGLVLKDTSTPNRADQASLEITLPDGQKIEYQVGVTHRALEACGVGMDATMLLALRGTDGVTRGLVLGRQGRGNSDFEFQQERESLKEVAPIESPRGFAWRHDDSGWRADYCQPH